MQRVVLVKEFDREQAYLFIGYGCHCSAPAKWNDGSGESARSAAHFLSLIAGCDSQHAGPVDSGTPCRCYKGHLLWSSGDEERSFHFISHIRKSHEV